MITLMGTLSSATAMGFSTPAAVIFKTPDATNLANPLSQDQTSWFGNHNKLLERRSTLIPSSALPTNSARQWEKVSLLDMTQNMIEYLQ